MKEPSSVSYKKVALLEICGNSSHHRSFRKIYYLEVFPTVEQISVLEVTFHSSESIDWGVHDVFDAEGLLWGPLVEVHLNLKISLSCSSVSGSLQYKLTLFDISLNFSSQRVWDKRSANVNLQ
jgi:hypothetical protein